MGGRPRPRRGREPRDRRAADPGRARPCSTSTATCSSSTTGPPTRRRRSWPTLADRHPGVDLISLGRNQGKATALRRGFERALAEGADVVVMMDADGQDDPAELPLPRGPARGRCRPRHRCPHGAQRPLRQAQHLQALQRGHRRGSPASPGKDFNSGFKAMRADVARDAAPMLYGELHRYLTVVAHWLGLPGRRGDRAAPRAAARQHEVRARPVLARLRGPADRAVPDVATRAGPRTCSAASASCQFLRRAAWSLGYLTVDAVPARRSATGRCSSRAWSSSLVGVQLVLFGLLAELVVYSRQRGTGAPSRERPARGPSSGRRGGTAGRPARADRAARRRRCRARGQRRGALRSVRGRSG